MAQMQWIKVSQYAIRCGEYRISKVSIADHIGYAAYHQWEWLGLHKTADEARAAAKRHSEGNGK